VQLILRCNNNLIVEINMLSEIKLFTRTALKAGAFGAALLAGGAATSPAASSSSPLPGRSLLAYAS